MSAQEKSIKFEFVISKEDVEDFNTWRKVLKEFNLDASKRLTLLWKTDYEALLRAAMFVKDKDRIKQYSN